MQHDVNYMSYMYMKGMHARVCCLQLAARASWFFFPVCHGIRLYPLTSAGLVRKGNQPPIDSPPMANWSQMGPRLCEAYAEPMRYLCGALLPLQLPHSPGQCKSSDPLQP